jgi:hypothetical protein
MASYYWEDNTIQSIVADVNILPATPYGTLGNVPLTFTHPLYDMTFTYLTNFHTAAPTQPSVRFINNAYNNITNGSIFPTTICPQYFRYSGVGTTGNYTLNGNENRMYILLKGSGGGGGGGGGGTNTSSLWGGGGGGGGTGAILGRLIPIVPGGGNISWGLTGRGNGGAGGRNVNPAPTNNAGAPGNNGGPAFVTYNGTSYVAAGGAGGGGGGLGFTPATFGAGGAAGGTTPGTSNILISAYDARVLQPGNAGAPGANTSVAGNRNASSFPFGQNTPTSLWTAEIHYGEGGNAGRGFRGPTNLSLSGSAGGDGLILIFFYYD